MNNADFSLLIYNIIHLMRTRKDFDSAAALIKEHNLTFELLTSKTYKLTQREIAILADKIIGS